MTEEPHRRMYQFLSRSRTHVEPTAILDPNGMRVVRAAAANWPGYRQRSYTDPTDLLAVFRRRISTLELNENVNVVNDSRGNGKGREKMAADVCGNTINADRLQGFLHKSSNESISSNRSLRNKDIMTNPGEAKDTNDTDKHSDRPSLHERKISAPAVRMGRRNSHTVVAVAAQRRCSVATIPRRMGRRGSEVPALSSIARRRSTLTPAYPVGLKGRGTRGFSNAEFHLNNIQVKAKHEMLANLVLPAFNETTFRNRERRTTCSCHPSTALTKKDEKRLHVTNEILETEKKYLACLNTLKKIFEDPLRDESILSVKEIDIIFPIELSLIRDSHTLFMRELQDRIQNWKQFGIVGDIFTKLSSSYHIDVLKIYTDYVNNFPKAMAVINKYSRGSQKFRRFLQNCSAEPECEGLDLAAYLLTPIQRLPRYVLLLRQLSKCTDASHPDSFHLENALETMKNMINILNDSIHNSSKIVSSSISRKSSKRRSLRKRGSLKELKITKDDNDNKIIQVSSQPDSTPIGGTSTTVANTPKNPPPASPKSPKSQEKSSSGSEHSILTRLRSGEKKSRPVSTGDLDRFYDSDQAREYGAILEEVDGKDDKSQGQSKFRSAAESVKRSWQRRSKKWRRSFEGKAISTNALQELEKEEENVPRIVFNSRGNKFNFDIPDTTLSPSISPSLSMASTPISGSTDGLKVVACNPTLDASSDGHESSLNPSPAISTSEITETWHEEAEKVNVHNVETINEQEELVIQQFPDQGSPYTMRQRQRKQGIQERPLSVALPVKKETNNNTMEDKAKSDNNILADSTPVWVHRQLPRLQKRHSDGALRHHLTNRKSSSISCASGTTGTSVGSLDNSKDSLIDSGVSASSDYSPTNTLTKSENSSRNLNNSGQVSVEERLAFDDCFASGFNEKDKDVKSVDALNEKTKSKNKIKNVLKHMFSKSRRRSRSSEEDTTTKPKPKLLTRAKSFTKDTTKESRTSLV